MVLELLGKKNCTMPVTLLRYSDAKLGPFYTQEQALYTVQLLTRSFHYRFHVNKLKSWTTRNCRYFIFIPFQSCITVHVKKTCDQPLYISQDGFHEKWDHGLLAELTMEHIQLWAIDTVIATSSRPYKLQNTLDFCSHSMLPAVPLPHIECTCFFHPPDYNVEGAGVVEYKNELMCILCNIRNVYRAIITKLPVLLFHFS